MRILLAHNSLYYPAHGGGDRSNRLLLEALAGRRHRCRVVARLTRFGDQEEERYLRELAARSIPVQSRGGGVVVLDCHGVEVHVVTHHLNLRAYFTSQIGAFEPDVILTSTDDPAQVLLEASLRAAAPTVFMARATLALPFGPDSAFPSAAKTAGLRQARAVVAVSRYVADYIVKWSGVAAAHVPISLLDPPPYPDLGRLDNEFVTMVNPCAVKGISIFLELAARMPEVQFAGVPTWGTNQADRAALGRRCNVTLLAPVDNVDEILRRTRVLLVPSLWGEARSRIVVEAMLRGVPVIASNIGGIPEAKLGVDYLLPVRPILKYRPQLDEQMVPMAEVPPQDIAPWQAALERLLAGRAHYEQLSRASRQAALEYAASLDVGPFEALLERAAANPKAAAAPAGLPAAPALERLSPERRKLAALRLRKHAAEAPCALRLFCFPHAGGGVAAFNGWSQRLPASALVVPMRSPGRNTMAEHVEALAELVERHIDTPFAFFGHSMGAAVAFEIARLLRRGGAPLPRLLVVSGARAPQFRRNHTPPPEPSEEQFIKELRRLQGVPPEVLDNPEMLRLVLPGLRADAALYRNYVYCDEPPLDCAIRAYGGTADPNVRREHLEGWGEQTTRSFRVRLFPSGHFFPQTCRLEVLAALSEDLNDSLGCD